MRALPWPRALLALTLVASTSLVACGDDDQGVLPDSGIARPDAPAPTDAPPPPPPTDAGDGGGGDPLFTDFVKGLIANDTKATTLPTTVNDKKFAADPQDPKAFPASFF
ncbi:MAG: hypothetical protein IPQ09_19090 [Myxococcales bacterium]|nr:hypothetical protein [Myxococcales bacterium]HQY59784.1 hypothetical protein [Polyangiaceae bacterium]